jgi:hypothetical protein
MNRKQRQVFLWLLLNIAIWSIFAFSGFVIYLSGKMTTLYVLGCAGCLVWFSFMWFLPFCKRPRSKTKIIVDERDLMITKQSMFAGLVSIWLYFIAVSIILWFAAGPNGSVPIGAFPVMLYVGMGIFSVISSLVSWFLYRKDNDAAEGESL